MDYVEFHFANLILRSLSNPTLTCHTGKWKFPNPGSRDAFYSVIGAVVDAVEVKDEVSITVRLISGHAILVPLDYESCVGPEAAHFVSVQDHIMDVW